MNRRHALYVAAAASLATTPADADAAETPSCPPMNLPIEHTPPPPAAYAAFCATHPGHCDMNGPAVAEATPRLFEDLAEVNRAVNARFRFMPDLEWLGTEEMWDYPTADCGDCEDFALEKRCRLVERGVPRTATSLAIVHHDRLLFSHAVLLVETTQGVFVLDNLRDEIACWNAIPFNFESRERPDGAWTRYDQRFWNYPPE